MADKRLSDAEIERAIQRIVRDHVSQTVVAAELGCPQPTLSRTLRRQDVAPRVRAERKREDARIRQRKHRAERAPFVAQAERDRADHERAIAADRDYVQNHPSLERHPSVRSGLTYPRIDRNGVVLRSPLGYFGRLEYATASTYRELGYRPPLPHVLAALDADPG